MSFSLSSPTSFSPSQLLPQHSQSSRDQSRLLAERGRRPNPHDHPYADNIPERLSSVKTHKPTIEQSPILQQPFSTFEETAADRQSSDSKSTVRVKAEPDTSHKQRLYMSRHDSDTPPSIFDHADQQEDGEDGQDRYSDPTQTTSREPSGEELPGSYDLKPPPPSVPMSNIEALAGRLFSVDHLKLLLQDNSFFTRFHSFLTKYRPNAAKLVAQYMDVQKALSAVEYANAIAEVMTPGTVAAIPEESFEAQSRDVVNDLVNDALPGYVTHRLVQIVTETLVKEITGQSMPIMKELVAGLAEVYCLTDPSLPDNPIVYASEEFYNTTQYGRDYVIGRNCRFLQGPKSSGATVQRMIDALAEGQEICETILNYRRDGSPFMNLLMIAPLYDNKGAVRYFIGAQIDVNGLIHGGRGLDSFERLLSQDRTEARFGDHMVKTPQQALADMSAMWTQDELDIVRSSGKNVKMGGNSGASTPVIRPHNTNRRILGMDDPNDKNLWPSAQLGPSGRLPGVFQNYLLVRPFPSLRITFTSPALRIPGLLQAKFMDRIGGPPHLRDGILSALSSGIGVTAKITWLPVPAEGPTGSIRSQGTVSSPNRGYVNNQDNDYSQRTPQNRSGSSKGPQARQTSSGTQEGFEGGKQRWIHCTPLLGSDDKVGVWMIVMVESENITGAINHERYQLQNNSSPPVTRSSEPQGVSPKFTGGKVFKEYLRREGRQDPNVGGGGAGTASAYDSQRVVVAGMAPRSQVSNASNASQRSRVGDQGNAPGQTRVGGVVPRALSRQQINERATAGEETFRDF